MHFLYAVCITVASKGRLVCISYSVIIFKGSGNQLKCCWPLTRRPSIGAPSSSPCLSFAALKILYKAKYVLSWSSVMISKARYYFKTRTFWVQDHSFRSLLEVLFWPHKLNSNRGTYCQPFVLSAVALATNQTCLLASPYTIVPAWNTLRTTMPLVWNCAISKYLSARQ